MGKYYYLDYENFATRNQRILRGALNSKKARSSKPGSDIPLSKEQSIAKKGFLKRIGLPKNTHLKNEGGSLNHTFKWSDTTDKLNDLGLDPDRHHTWAERKAARTQKYNSGAIRDHILKNAVVKD